MLKEFQIRMIKQLIVIIFILLIAVGCKDRYTVFDAADAISKYELTIEDGYDLKNTNWKRNGKIYGNKKTDSCLIVLINKKGDTILTHLDKGIESWYISKTIKVNKEYFVIKRDFPYVEMDSTKPDYNPSKATVAFYSYNDIDYPMDHFYRLDSVNKKLEVVKLISKPEIEKKIKKIFHFKEKIKILASTNKYTYIAKDTLRDSQVYYQINTTYVPQKKENGWILEPNISTKFADVYKMGVYKNNITSSSEWLGNTFARVSIDSLGQNIRRYDIYLKYYTKFSCNTEKYNYCHDSFVKLEIILRDKKKNERKNLETFTSDTFFKNQNFNMFKYKNGEYFIGVLPKIDKEYKLSLFRLDTINWKLEQLEKFDRKKDIIFERYEKGKNFLISGNTSAEMATFLNEYEIVKAQDSYKLID